MAFTCEFSTEGVERQSPYNIVVIFVSPGRDSNGPEIGEKYFDPFGLLRL